MHSGQHKGTIDILGVVSSNRHKSQALISESPYHFAGQVMLPEDQGLSY